jgi:hypothetical protein
MSEHFDAADIASEIEDNEDGVIDFDEIENLRSRLYQERQDHGRYIGMLKRVYSDQIAATEKRAKLEAAEHILYLWNEPWVVTEMPFIDRLKYYIEELK